MKKYFFLILILALALTGLTACGTATAAATNASTQPAAASETIQSRLAVGTLLLKDTDLAVTKDEAAELLFLWKAVKTLSSANNAADEEVQALYDQIQETMTPAQVEAIQALQLDAEKLGSLRTELGLGMNAEAKSDSTSSSSSSRRASNSGGGMGPGGMGGPPMGDPGMMAGGGIPPEMQTQSAGQTNTTAARGGAGQMFIEPLITYLTSVANS